MKTKKLTIILAAVFAIFCIAGFTACNTETEQAQSTQISGLWGKATVKGNYTDTEWAGVANGIKSQLDSAWNADGIYGYAFQESAPDAFSGNYATIINVVANPVGYERFDVQIGIKELNIRKGASLSVEDCLDAADALQAGSAAHA